MENILSVLDNKYVSTVLSIFLALYAGLAKPTLPTPILKLFNNQVFRILVLSLIAYRANRDPQLSIMIAVAFTVSLNMLAERNMKESFEQMEHFVQLQELNEHFEQEIDENQYEPKYY